MGCAGGSGSPPPFPEAGATCVGEPGCPCYESLTCNPPFLCSPFLICAQPDAGANPDVPGIPTGGTDAATGVGGIGGQDGAVGGASGGFAVDAPVATRLDAGGVSTRVDARAGSPDVGGLAGAGGNAGARTTGGNSGTGGARPIDGGAGGVPADAGPEPVLNGACSTVGALHCVGHAQKGMMMCDGSKWVPNGACSGTLLCDTMPGPSQGTCVAPLANCANQVPGYSYCSGNSKVTCGPDLVTVSGETCPFICSAGQCTGECVPSSKDCRDNIPLSCATNAMWLTGTACVGDCNKGVCCAAAAPTNCGGTCVDLQSNNSNCGACGTLCSSTGGKSCRAGLCQCPAGMTDCNGTCVSLATSSANCGACGEACADGKTCQASLCACPTGTLECLGVCTNVQTDKANCGACGVSCGTSTCYAGTCGGENLIANGDFSDGITNWKITQADSGVTSGMLGGEYCVSLPAYAEAYFGWGDSLISVPLAAGYGYTFAYTVSSTATLSSFTAKIGHAIKDYTVVYSASSDRPGLTPTTFTHSFTPTYGDTGAGIAFYMYASSAGATVCYSNVSLVRH